MEKLLKKGQKEDRILSSAISCALCIQLGEGESLKVFTTLKPILITMINDESVSPSARASVSRKIIILDPRCSRRDPIYIFAHVSE